MEAVKWGIQLNEQQLKEKQALAAQMKAHPLVQNFLQTYGLDESWVENYPYRFHQWIDQLSLCQNCPGLNQCHQKQKGEVLDLSYTGFLTLQVRPCRYARQQLQAEKHVHNYRINDLPRRLWTVSITDINIDEEEAAYAAAVAKISQNLLAPAEKGLYLFGAPGVGKTYLAACACNSFARQGKRVVFVHVPTMASRIKGLLDDRDSFEDELYEMKRADFAVFDDIGAESVTSWLRDEVLLPIFNERMDRQKLTWFTSNENFSSLENHYMYNQKSDKEELKAVRIMERIKALSKEMKITGKNRRNTSI